MRFIQRLLFLLVSTILLISVYAQEVHYNYDRGATSQPTKPTSG
jgi:hypothetical protein